MIIINDQIRHKFIKERKRKRLREKKKKRPINQIATVYLSVCLSVLICYGCYFHFLCSLNYNVFLSQNLHPFLSTLTSENYDQSLFSFFFYTQTHSLTHAVLSFPFLLNLPFWTYLYLIKFFYLINYRNPNQRSFNLFFSPSSIKIH